MVGGDVIFGDGQNDMLIGGCGADWISGGTGDDGILGDDGRLLMSRVGSDEPLYGIVADAAASLDQLITTPGTMQQATINVSGALRYTADLTPDNVLPGDPQPTTTMASPRYANDVLYGGLGNDAIHGGAGDDAISGAEAPDTSYTAVYNGSLAPIGVAESDFGHPFNTGNVLGYSDATTYQAQYLPGDPFRKITLNADGTNNTTSSTSGGSYDWLLNFTSTEGVFVPGGTPPKGPGNVTTYPSANSDGNDILFGDLGNDWLVGGTGRDQMFGGWGNDYLNADDVLNTGGNVLNLGTDTSPSYEDLAFGGAGRDVLVANTGGDRLIDWTGEFNSYLTEFAPFGMATVSRTIQPQLPEFLYALAKSDGADQTLGAEHGSTLDPVRDGEPFGELGLITQQDAAWGDQRGKPRDPQAGNTPGAQRDVLRTAGADPIESPGPGTLFGSAAVVRSLAAPTVQMAAFVGINDQTLAPLVVVGTPGALATFTISDGTHSVTGSGVIGADGKVAFAPDVSALVDGTLTTTVRLTFSGLASAPGTTTTVKNTVIPGSVGIAAPGFVGLANLAAASLVLYGDPGNFVTYELDGPGGSIIDAETFDATGALVLALDMRGYADGIYAVSATQYSKKGFNPSAVGVSTPTLTVDTVKPTGAFTVDNAPSNTALTNNPAVSLQLSFGDDRTGVYLVQYSMNGGATWSAWQSYASTLNGTLPSPDGTYTVAVQVSDKAGNTFLATQRVILDRTGPSITYSVPAPTNAGSYDVGAALAFSFAATDANGVASISSKLDTSISLTSGGRIDIDSLMSGTHTVIISSTDRAGNVSSLTFTFTIHATPQGIVNAINDAATRGWVTTSYAGTLVTQMQQVIKAGLGTANAKAKLKQFITYVQYPPAGALTSGFQALLLNWANDLLSRS
jgi:hypothetical protein